MENTWNEGQMGELLSKIVENNSMLSVGQADLNMTIKSLIGKTDAIGERVLKLDNDLYSIKDSYKKIDMRMNNLELDSEIDDVQVKSIQAATKKRVYKVLSNESQDIINKIYRVFIGRMYVDLRKDYGLGSSMAITKKRDYDRVMQGIDSWYPSEYQKMKEKAILSHENRLKDKARIDAMALKSAIEQITDNK